MHWRVPFPPVPFLTLPSRGQSPPERNKGTGGREAHPGHSRRQRAPGGRQSPAAPADSTKDPARAPGTHRAPRLLLLLLRPSSSSPSLKGEQAAGRQKLGSAGGSGGSVLAVKMKSKKGTCLRGEREERGGDPRPFPRRGAAVLGGQPRGTEPLSPPPRTPSAPRGCPYPAGLGAGLAAAGGCCRRLSQACPLRAAAKFWFPVPSRFPAGRAEPRGSAGSGAASAALCLLPRDEGLRELAALLNLFIP